MPYSHRPGETLKLILSSVHVSNLVDLLCWKFHTCLSALPFFVYLKSWTWAFICAAEISKGHSKYLKLRLHYFAGLHFYVLLGDILMNFLLDVEVWFLGFWELPCLVTGNIKWPSASLADIAYVWLIAKLWEWELGANFSLASLTVKRARWKILLETTCNFKDRFVLLCVLP